LLKHGGGEGRLQSTFDFGGKDFVNFTWEVIDKYIIYATNGYKKQKNSKA